MPVAVSRHHAVASSRVSTVSPGCCDAQNLSKPAIAFRMSRRVCPSEVRHSSIASIWGAKLLVNVLIAAPP